MTTTRYDIEALVQWVGGPEGHTIEMGIVAFVGTRPVFVDASVASIIREDLGSEWNYADFAWRFRGGVISNAYGNPWAEPRTPHGYPVTALGIQSEAWATDAEYRDIDPAATAAIVDRGTDCRDPATYLKIEGS